MRRGGGGGALWRALAGSAILLAGLAGCTEDVVPRPVAVGECPPWGQSPPRFYENGPSVGGGCAQNVNLLNMVERASDTVSGRPLGPANGELQSLAVKNYETDKVTPLMGGSTTSSVGGSSGSQ